MTEYIFVKEDSRSHNVSLWSGTKGIRYIYLIGTHNGVGDMSADPGQFILRYEGESLNA